MAKDQALYGSAARHRAARRYHALDHETAECRLLGGAMGAVGVSSPTSLHYGIFFGAFMLASFLWPFVRAGMVVTVFGQADSAWVRLTYYACALAFLLLALASLRNLWQAEQAPSERPITPASSPVAPRIP